MKVVVDQDVCVGAGQCVLTAPQVFDQDESDGVVILLAESPSPELQDRVREAAALCPAMAITIKDS